MTSDFTLVLSLLSLGFFGGFSHCIGMCGPFVLTQVSNRLQKISIENFSQFQRLKNLALLPYHLGRITTYSVIGFICSLCNKNIQDLLKFKMISALLLLFASLFFLSLFFEKKFFFRLRFKSKFLENFLSFFSKKISFLFLKPQGFNGYLLGIILGFIPCGLLYGAFLIAAAISNAFFAGVGMFCFGIATFPALFFTAFGSNFLLKFSEFKIIAKTAILINSILLLLMAIKSIK
jgi:hypothetical protein